MTLKKSPGNNGDKLGVELGTVEKILQLGPVQRRQRPGGVGQGQYGQAGSQRAHVRHVRTGQLTLLQQVTYQAPEQGIPIAAKSITTFLST